MSDKKTGDDDFRRLLSNHSCDCNNKNCRELLRRYFYDSSSCYPNNKKQLLYRLTNPSKSGGKVQPKRQQRQQQVYNRAAFLLKVEKAHDKDYIHIGIIHYSPHVIHHYNNDVSDRKEKVFTDYLLPSSLVSNSKLGVKFTSVDKFNCIGTTKELSMCRKNNGKCKCNRYMNAPFVSGTTNVIVNTSSAWGKRKQTFSDGCKISMSSAEAEVQGTRADRYKKENERLKTEVKDKDNKLTKTKSELESVKKQLDYAKKVKSPLLKQVSSLKRDTERLERDREQLYVEKEKLAEKEERSSKKAKRHYDINRRSASPTDANGRIPLDELKRMGLCRRSLLDRSWHAHFDEASRSLLNFESFDECMGYIGILFPQLRDEIATLNRVGAEQYVSNTRLTPLEHCLLCRASPKMGITDKQIGFIYGIKAPAVSKIKKKWMPLWGYAGKQLTDLELYDDYVDKERPDAYYENDLPDMGTQCDGKDFLCESFRRSSSLNRAQRSSKVKHAALRCITWTSLCGLVWAFTPLVLARLTENALVHWYGEFKDGDDMYVPISMSDWTVSSDEDEHDDDGEEEGDDDAEETMVVSIERVNERDNQLEHHDEDEDEDEQQSDDDKDERIKECYEDMDDMSLSGRSEDGSEDGAFEQEEDGCIDLDKELEKFDKELLDKNKDKKLISKDLLRINEINAMAQEVLNSGPDRNGKAKLEQLEMLQELHVEYEEGRLKRCLLSMYLKLTVHHREKLIKQLQMYRDGKLEDPPKIPRRLAKLSRSYKVLADRGFDGDNLSYPHFNMVVTPEFYDKESKQFTLAQLERDRKICELRYTCEVVFSRVTTERMLGGVIPYSAFAHIEDAHCWAHAQANLRQPLQMPGSAGGLGHYFDEYEECHI